MTIGPGFADGRRPLPGSLCALVVALRSTRLTLRSSAPFRQPLSQTAHGEATDALKQEIEDRVGDPTNAHELEARLVGDPGAPGSRDEGDLVHGAKGGVAPAQDQARRPFELGDPVLERDALAQEGDAHLETAAETHGTSCDATGFTRRQDPTRRSG